MTNDWSLENPGGIEVLPIPAGGYIARTGHPVDGPPVQWAYGDTPREALTKLAEMAAR